MTVQNTTSVAQFNGDGVNKAFPIAFKFFDNTDLVVTKTDAAGAAVQLVLGTDYTVAGAGNERGGTVTMTKAPATGESIAVARVLTFQQLTDLRNQGRFYPEVHESVFDYLTMLAQQLSESDGRSLKRPRGKMNYDAQGRRIINLGDAQQGTDAATLNNVNSAVNSSIQGERDARAAADANLQQQIGGQIPLESSAFSPISWHDQEISNSVNIPNGVNAWSFGPQIAIDEGQVITVGDGSSWTIADGEQYEKQKYDISDALLPGRPATLGDVMRKAQAGQMITISCYGDSITYGQDTSADGQPTQINGATQTRSRFPYPDCLNESLGFAGINKVVNNYGYPGDNCVTGLNRWKNTGPSDLVIIMYGHNDAVGYGGLPLQTIAQYREALRLFVKREQGKGAAVILMAPPQVKSQGQNNTIRPYAYAMREVATEYGVNFVDAQEQLLTIPSDKYWTDDVHLSTFAYNELGWHLASFLVRRDGVALKASAGAHFYAGDFPGFGGSMVNDSTARGGQLVKVDPGLTLSIGVECEEEVRAVITSVNTSANPVILNAYYAGAKSQYRGLDYASLTHVSSRATRQTLSSQVLKKGVRTLYIKNDGAENAYIESVRFVPASQPVFSGGFFVKSDALSGLFCPSSWPYSDWVSIADHANRIAAPCLVKGWVTLPDGNLSGIAMWPGVAAQNEFLGDLLWVNRSGTTLEVRQMVNGALSTLGSSPNAFTGGATFEGDLTLELDANGKINVYLDGVSKLTGLTPPFTSGCPGFLGSKNVKWKTHGVLLRGVVKSPY